MATIRQKLNGPVGYGLAGGVLVVALLVYIFSEGPQGPERQFTLGSYYFDTATGELFVAPVSAFPPVKAPGGGETGVEANVFACGGCSESSDRFVAYMMKYTDEAKAKLTGGEPLTFDERDKLAAEGIKKSGNGKDWFGVGDEANDQLIISANQRCKGKGKRTECKPTAEEVDAGKPIGAIEITP